MIRDQLIAAIRAAASGLGLDPVPAEIGLERPGQRDHGDWSTNLALVTSKSRGVPPRQWAGELVEALTAADLPHVTAVEVAGLGFVNFRLSDSWLHDVIAEVAESSAVEFGRSEVGSGTKVIVEFISANPTGPLHAGHGRGACYGDAVARLFEHTGFEVEREFYINDRGVQMLTFAESLAACRDGRDVPEDGYKGEYIREWADEMPAGVDPLEWGYERALRSHRETLARLDIVFDTWFSERAMIGAGAIETTLADLRARGVVYDADGAVWLRSSDHGDDKDRVLVKSDGEFTYLLPDVAYHRDKFRRADLLVNVWGADHHGYVPRMKAAMQSLGQDPAQLDVAITQLVRLERDGEEVRLSKRSGDLITLDDLIDEIGVDAVRFLYLIQSVDSGQTLDLAVAASHAMENPVFYVQMAHARLCSIERKAAEAGVVRAPLADVDLTVLDSDSELDVARVLFTFAETVRVAATDRAPHRVTSWARELAGTVHRFYHDCWVLGEGITPAQTQARLTLVAAGRVGLAAGLGLVGVTAPESM